MAVDCFIMEAAGERREFDSPLTFNPQHSLHLHENKLHLSPCAGLRARAGQGSLARNGGTFMGVPLFCALVRTLKLMADAKIPGIAIFSSSRERIIKWMII